MKCKDFVCMCCGEHIHDADDCYDMCSPSDVNDIKGSVCEHCFENHSDKELYDKTQCFPCDSM